MTVTPSIAGLAPGTYTTPITVTATGASGSPKTVDVTLTVNPATPVLSVAPTSLAFSATQGGANPAAQTVNVTNTGGGSLSFTASDDAVLARRDAGERDRAGRIFGVDEHRGLAPGTYTGTVTISAAGASGSPKTVAVTLTVNPATPVLSVAPTSLAFSATQGGANPAAQTVSVTNTGGGTLNFTASDNQSWLAVTPASGTAPANPSVSTNIAGLAPGNYTGTVTISAAGASGSPKTVGVTLTVNPAPPARDRPCRRLGLR